MERAVAYIDGASRGNPGEAAFGVCVCAPDGTEVAAFADYLGRQTNNVAEYRALLAALRWAHEHGVRELRVRSDSELLVRQMRGEYRVKSRALRALFEEARALASRLPRFAIEHVPRDRTRAADRLASRAINLRAPVRGTG